MFTLNALFTWWWLALPTVLLPLWWHRQRQKQQQVFPLASAQFLPNAEPQTVQVWRWRELILLLLRLAMLLCLIALLAQFIRGQRGDTVFVSKKANPTWIAAQLAQLNQLRQQSKSLEVLEYCEHAPCDIQTDSIFAWLEQHQAQWQDSSRWYLLAAEAELSMPAQAPRFTPAFELRIAPQLDGNKGKVPASPAQTIAVYLNTPRADDWRKWFQVFEVSSQGQLHFVLEETMPSKVQLIVWERDSAPEEGLKAPLWWTTNPSLQQGAQTASHRSSAVALSPQTPLPQGGNGSASFKQFETARGRVWFADQRDWPLHSDDSLAAWRLFEAWRASQTTFMPPPAVSYQSPAMKDVQKQGPNVTHFNSPTTQQFSPRPAWEVGKSLRSECETILLSLFVLFFLCERVLHHAKRKA
ncbi:hypothetical protein RF679_01825 [Undibacterium cyanobacteriorum]|uniref:Aerotolerance regulator N-terminal domain-containing protein n=1 Tax=Undibacterium cyanobacteriorum TaxID=3073561 RepID=A0ABY9RIM5_9BURK|nr:BatA domain-containing protein [Undibacterium sp. 20NA77.5]WMW81032.1 hypothetical protein RF679_01825 [Undibacterium sp. 20NA77.5]